MCEQKTQGAAPSSSRVSTLAVSPQTAQRGSTDSREKHSFMVPSRLCLVFGTCSRHMLTCRRHLHCTCTIWASVGGRLSAAAATLAPHGTDAGIGSRGVPLVRRPPRHSFPSHSDRTCAATRGRHARTSGRESRGSAGSPRQRLAARRARAARAAARRGRLAGRRVGGGRAGGRRVRAARVELSSILGGLTTRSRGTPAHLRQSFHPPLPASRLEGGSTPAGVGARRALGMVAAIWGRRGMVGGTAVINQALQGR
jgi:hypothetical protein